MSVNLPTVRDVRAMLADLPDDAPLLVLGYEGGYDAPELGRVNIDPEPYDGGGGVYGVWAGTDRGDHPQSPCAEPVGAFVLGRADAPD